MSIPPSSYCLECGYPLRGLPSNRCPECGEKFDPLNADSYGCHANSHAQRRSIRRLKRAAVSPWLVIPATWVSLQIPILGLFAVIAGLAALGPNLYRKRWLASAALFLGSPIIGFLAFGSFDYFRGQGKVRFYGLGGTESHNVDPEYRCERMSLGCMITGNESLTDDVYNLALRSLIAGLGPMRGAYTGPYPTRDESLIALQNSHPIPADRIMNEHFVVCGVDVRLDRNVGPALLGRSLWARAYDDPDGLAKIVRDIGPIEATFNRGVLILRIPAYSRDTSSSRDSAMIALIDPPRGRPFAYYATGGYWHHHPPVGWCP